MSIGRRIALTWLGFGAGALVVCLSAPLIGSSLSVRSLAAIDGTAPKNSTPSATVISRTSAIDLPL